MTLSPTLELKAERMKTGTPFIQMLGTMLKVHEAEIVKLLRVKGNLSSVFSILPGLTPIDNVLIGPHSEVTISSMVLDNPEDPASMAMLTSVWRDKFVIPQRHQLILSGGPVSGDINVWTMLNPLEADQLLGAAKYWFDAPPYEVVGVGEGQLLHMKNNAVELAAPFLFEMDFQGVGVMVWGANNVR